MSDEETIKRRLLIDGDGTGEDRRLNLLLKQFLKWVDGKGDTPESNQIMYDRLVGQLAQCEFAVLKNQRTLKMLNEELANYTQLSNQIEKNIELAKEEIENSKQELALAKEIRKHKMEYDMLAKLIEEQPDRKEIIQKIDNLKKDIDKLIEKKLKIEVKYDKRRNDFTLLMYAVAELEKKIEQESNSDNSSDNEHDKRPETEVTSISTVMEISEDEDVIRTTNQLNKSELDGSIQNAKDHSISIEDSKEHMSIDEDAVLELSIDKDDDHDVDAAVVAN